MEEEQKTEKKLNEKKESIVETNEEPIETEKKEEVKEEKQEEIKEKSKTSLVEKKEFALAKGKDLPISLKHAKFICKYIKGKSIQDSLDLMKKVSEKKIYVPMKGELACRKKGIKGRYPVKASREFIHILKSLRANANVAGLLNPVIAEAIVNKASQPYKKGGLRFKRTYLLLKAREKQENKVKGEGK